MRNGSTKTTETFTGGPRLSKASRFHQIPWIPLSSILLECVSSSEWDHSEEAKSLHPSPNLCFRFNPTLKTSSANMFGEHRGPEVKDKINKMVLKKLCQLLMVLLMCLPATKGHVPEEPNHFNVTLGEDVILSCGLKLPENNKTVPYMVQWLKQGIEQPIYIWRDRFPPHTGEGFEGRLSLAPQASLILAKVRDTDRGRYKCRITYLNRPPEFQIDGSWVHLDVLAAPNFKMKPPDAVYVTVGESVTLPCEAKGTLLNLTWYKDNSPLQESRTVQILSTELRISNLLQTDAGDYTCMATTEQGTENATSSHKELNRFSANLGEDVILFCDFEFSLNKTVPYLLQWLKKGIEQPIYVWYNFQPSFSGAGYEGRLSLLYKASLKLTNVSEGDQGWYQCRVAFLDRPQDHDKNGTWVHLDVQSPASIVVPPRNVTRLEGDRAEFICEAKALPSNVTHRWFHNGVEINQLPWLANRTAVRKDGTLIIYPFSHEDSGEFTCEVTNGIGTPDTASAFLSLGYPARAVFSPTIQYLQVGVSGVIRCYFQSNPPFLFVQWTKDDRQFNPYSVPDLETLDDGSLLFLRVTHSVQGRYQCTPYNVYGTAGTSNVTNVLVREPPMFTLKPYSIYQKPVDSEIKLPCEGVGDPKPVLTWRRTDGSKLPSERVLIEGGNLTIRELKKEDSGRYECVLENEIATLVTSALLLVETTSHGPTEVTVNTSTVAATVLWLPAYDRLKWLTYEIRYRVADQDDSDWKTIVDSYYAFNFTVYNLQADTEYVFQVISKDKFGNEMFSPIVRAKTKRDFSYRGRAITAGVVIFFFVGALSTIVGL